MTAKGSASAQACISEAKGAACRIAKARLQTEFETHRNASLQNSVQHHVSYV